MALPEIPVTFNNVLKSPLTYSLIFATIVATIFINSFISTADGKDAICEKEKAELRLQLKEKDMQIKEKDDKLLALVTALLVKQGVIDNLSKIKDTTITENGNKE